NDVPFLEVTKEAPGWRGYGRKSDPYITASGELEGVYPRIGGEQWIQEAIPGLNVLRVTGHEGRHRNRAMAQEGIDKALMRVGEPWIDYGTGVKAKKFGLDDPIEPQTFNLKERKRPIRAGDVFLTEPFKRGGVALAGGGLPRKALSYG